MAVKIPIVEAMLPLSTVSIKNDTLTRTLSISKSYSRTQSKAPNQGIVRLPLPRLMGLSHVTI